MTPGARYSLSPSWDGKVERGLRSSGETTGRIFPRLTVVS